MPLLGRRRAEVGALAPHRHGRAARAAGLGRVSFVALRPSSIPMRALVRRAARHWPASTAGGGPRPRSRRRPRRWPLDAALADGVWPAVAVVTRPVADRRAAKQRALRWQGSCSDGLAGLAAPQPSHPNLNMRRRPAALPAQFCGPPAGPRPVRQALGPFIYIRHLCISRRAVYKLRRCCCSSSPTPHQPLHPSP